MPQTIFSEYLKRWELIPDGVPIITHASRLLPVRKQGKPAMLKVALEAEEKFGGLLMKWWEGEGAATVLASDADAILLERAEGTTSLVDMASEGQDDEASRIVCNVVAKLHAPRNSPPPDLIPLTAWFADLGPAASKHGGVLSLSAKTARELLGAPREVVVLHGDIHHGNILDFGQRGWLAIDPKRLVGERGFDYANLFCNPDYQTATAPARFARRLEVVTMAAGLDRKRLVKWILAWAGLSTAWSINDNWSATVSTRVAELAAAELER